MAQSSEDIQNNNFQLGRSFPTTVSSDGTPQTLLSSTLEGGDTTTSSFPTSSSVLAKFIASNIDNLGEEGSLSSIGSITYNDEYLEDPFPDLTLENLHIPQDYVDPSLGYVFVNNVDNQHNYLDNSQALLQQLEHLGVRVNDDDYSMLEFEIHTTSSVGSVVSNASDYVGAATSVGELDNCDSDCVFDEVGREKEALMKIATTGKGRIITGSTPSAFTVCDLASQKEQNLEKSLNFNEKDNDDDELYIEIEDLDQEVAEAEISPSGGVKVTYDNHKKEYRSRVSSQENFLRFLELVHDRTEDPTKGTSKPPVPVVVHSKHSLEQYKRLLRSFHKKLKISEKVTTLSSLPNKYSKKIQKMLAEEMTYDVMTPDSGVHENFTNLTTEEQEKQREEWKAELIKTEEEIQTLRQVLGSKVKHAQDLKRRLGITVWREFTDDFNQSMKTVRESQTTQYVQSLQVYRRMSGAFVDLGEAIYQQPVYQKTAGAIGAVGEKTSSLFGGIGAKFGQLKETPTFKSFEERVGGVYSAARTKMGGSGSNSTQDFEEALKEAEGEKAAANGGTVPSSTTPGAEVVTQPAAS